MDKHVERLEHSQIRYVYRHFMKKDFPDNERRPLASIKKSVKKGIYDCFGLFDGEEICGYAFFVRCIETNKPTACLFDYFAIKRELRGLGLGSSFLGKLKEYLQDAECILCEVENPAFAKNPDDRIRQMRRLQFYQRSGFCDAGVTAKVFGVEYRILEWPLSHKHTAGEIQAAYQKIYQSLLPQRIYQYNIHLHSL